MEANAEYLRIHTELSRAAGACFCPWGHITVWWSVAQGLGDPEWRAVLAGQAAVLEVLSLVYRAEGQPPRALESGGRDGCSSRAPTGR